MSVKRNENSIDKSTSQSKIR